MKLCEWGVIICLEEAWAMSNVLLILVISDYLDVPLMQLKNYCHSLPHFEHIWVTLFLINRCKLCKSMMKGDKKWIK